jgi:peptidoglycan hydrolase CwlO-like protein
MSLSCSCEFNQLTKPKMESIMTRTEQKETVDFLKEEIQRTQSEIANIEQSLYNSQRKLNNLIRAKESVTFDTQDKGE